MAGRAIMNRTDDLIRLYRILDKLEASSGGKRFLAQLAPSGSWPRRGVYFFFEPGEGRTGSGQGPRLVRIGTHGVQPCTSACVSMPESRPVPAEITEARSLEILSERL